MECGSRDFEKQYRDAQHRAKSLADLNGINDALHADPNRRLLLLDSRSGQFVPGTFSRPEGLGEYMTDADHMVAQTRNVSPESHPLVVTWMGYDAPQSVVNFGPHLLGATSTNDAADIKFANAAAPALDNFQTGLRASHDGPASLNTVVGHSYGTVVVGDAAAHGRTLDADNVVLLASP